MKQLGENDERVMVHSGIILLAWMFEESTLPLMRTRMTRSRGDADRNMFADSLWNARARAREAAELAARGERAQAVGA